MVTTEDPDYEDHMSTYDAAFICTSGKEDAVVFFTSTEILLDNQASRSIFCNSQLLMRIKDSTTLYIGGIDSSLKGMLVEHQGRFGFFANGGATGGTLILTDEDMTRRIAINWLTGAIVINSEPAP